MKYNEIIGYFESEDKIAELLNRLKKECFDVIDNYNVEIVQGAIGTSDELTQAKTVLNGIVST